MNNKNEFSGPAMVSLMVIIAFTMLFANHKAMLDNTDRAYGEGRACNLNKDTQTGVLAKTLHANGYVSHVEDANFVAAWITNKLHDHDLPNLGALNKKAFLIPVDSALEKGGSETRERALQAIADLGCSDEVERLYGNLPEPMTVTTDNGCHLLEVQVLRQDSCASRLRKLLSKDWTPAPNVAVCLRGHSYVSPTDEYGNITDNEARDSIIAYAVTDNAGVAHFKVPTGFYSVLPVRRGFSYGPAQGTSDHALDENTKWTFHERGLTITPLSAEQFSRVKQDLALTVRTPAEYRDSLVFSLMLFLGCWWMALMLLLWMDRRRMAKKAYREHAMPFDHVFLTMLMALTAIGLVTMMAIAQPLQDMGLGHETAIGIALGVAAMTVTAQIDLPRLFNNRRFLNPEGPGYLRFFAMALALMALLLLFGSGPQGSNAKVNLGPFQPSEISKYLIVLAMAVFFARNAVTIQAFAKHADIKLQGRLLRGIGACMAAVMAAYTVLSDMGPALVTAMTFILLYSVARKDTPQLFTGTISFIAVLIWAHHVNPTAKTMLAFALMWLIAWVAWGAACHKRLYESAVMMAAVIAAFVFAGDFFAWMGLEHIANRLNSRVAMAWDGVWSNDVAGGDQVAQGVWGLATGGWTGQGLGQGNPNLIPAFHTDMVLASIGETMGWITIALIIVCLAALLHRTLLLARRAGHTFVFFLLTGIALATGIQFFAIALGSLGLIALTGVAVPLLSYGKTSMIVNLAAFGLVLAGSRVRGSENQRRSILPYDNVVAASAVAFIGLSAVTLLCMMDYQVLRRNSFLARPAVVANAKGVAFAEYNPRIMRLERKLLAGNIYDRNGLLLATSNPEDIRGAAAQLAGAGLDRMALDTLARKKQHRYYPFGMHTVFAVGDRNDALVNDNGHFPIGYGAEYRHSMRLRGFEPTDSRKDDSKVVAVNSRHYRPSKFLPETVRTFSIPLHNYNDPKMIKLLKAGENSRMVRKWNEKRSKRDLHLTIDARLQTLMQERLQRELAPVTRAGGSGARGKLRASVVVIKADDGDLLCSANYPMPTRVDISSNRRYSDIERDRSAGTVTPQDLGTTFLSQPGSTAKVITQMAAFRKLGSNAADITYNIRANERIHETRTGVTNMETALVRSINAFHIHLAHDRNLYRQLAEIDYLVGMRLHLGFDSHDRRIPYMPFYFTNDEQRCDSSDYYNEMQFLAQEALPLYRQRLEQNRLVQGRAWTTAGQFGIAWGQHNIFASPLTMARVAGIVANDGEYAPTRFVMDEPVAEPVRVISHESAATLQGYMRAESRRHGSLPPSMGGKTGTPMRDMPGRGSLVNDAWYVCFIPLTDGTPLAIALRLERSVRNSSMAVEYISRLVLNTLRDAGYDINAGINNN